MKQSLASWVLRYSAVGLALATATSVLTEVPANAATMGGNSTTAQIVAHALQYAPSKETSAPYASADPTWAWSRLANETPTRLTPQVVIGIAGATATVTSKAGIASLTPADPADSVVQPQPGGVRELTVLHQGNIARFVISLPGGATVHQASNGGLLVLNRASQAIGVIAAPWAIDARGKRLPSHYTVAGNVIVQRIQARGAVYPIVADPSFRWYWDGVVITLSWADQMAVAQGGLEVLAPMLLASGFGWTVVGPVAWLAGWAGIYATRDRCFWFWIPYINPLGINWGTYAC